jgi:hypothetical protein
MSRISKMGIGLGLILFGLLWCLIGLTAFIGLALSQDSVPGASIFGPVFLLFFLIWGVVFAAIVYAVFLNFRRSLVPQRINATSEVAPSSEVSHGLADGSTPDEKLAHLVKKKKTAIKNRL